jgi:transcriptional regulator with XRE-family HTH domain
VSIDKAIRRVCFNKGLKLDELAVMTTLTKAYLSKIKNADQASSVSTLQTLAVALLKEIETVMNSCIVFITF